MKKSDLASLHKSFQKIRSIDEFSAFFEDLFSDKELETIIERWEIAKRLHKGSTYREVAEDLGVSTATVTRVGKCLRRPESGYRLILERV